MPTDCLVKQEIANHCKMLLNNFDLLNPVSSWELLKVKIQARIQSLMKFYVKQVEAEMKSLKSSLRYVNKRIFQGDDLDMDRKRLEARILATQDRIWFTSESNDYDIE